MSNDTDRTTVSRRYAIIEVLIVIALALLSREIMFRFFWGYAGPVSLVAVLIFLTVYLRRRGERWSSMGLISLPGWRAKLMLIPKTVATMAAVAVILAPIIIGAEHFQIKFITELPEGVDDRWGDVEGNLPLFLLWLGIVWTAAAFGEEMFFRGYLITRAKQIFEGAPIASFWAVLLPALIFGYGHVYYQGLRGLIIVTAIGLAFGTMFLLFKRNLWPMILLHGILDTMAFTMTYLGLQDSV